MYTLGQIMLECLSGLSFINFSPYEMIIFKIKHIPQKTQIELKHLYAYPNETPKLVTLLNELIAELMNSSTDSQTHTWKSSLSKLREIKLLIESAPNPEPLDVPRVERLIISAQNSPESTDLPKPTKTDSIKYKRFIFLMLIGICILSVILFI